MQADRRRGIPVLVGPQKRAQVEVGEHVAVEGEETILELVPEGVGGEADRPGGAQRLGLGDVADPHPRPLLLAIESRLQHVGQESAGKHHLGHPVPRQPLDHVGEKGPVDQRQRRLRHVRGQGPQPRPLAAD